MTQERFEQARKNTHSIHGVCQTRVVHGGSNRLVTLSYVLKRELEDNVTVVVHWDEYIDHGVCSGIAGGAVISKGRDDNAHSKLWTLELGRIEMVGSDYSSTTLHNLSYKSPLAHLLGRLHRCSPMKSDDYGPLLDLSEAIQLREYYLQKVSASNLWMPDEGAFSHYSPEVVVTYLYKEGEACCANCATNAANDLSLFKASDVWDISKRDPNLIRGYRALVDYDFRDYTNVQCENCGAKISDTVTNGDERSYLRYDPLMTWRYDAPSNDPMGNVVAWTASASIHLKGDDYFMLSESQPFWTKLCSKKKTLHKALRLAERELFITGQYRVEWLWTNI